MQLFVCVKECGTSRYFMALQWMDSRLALYFLRNVIWTSNKRILSITLFFQHFGVCPFLKDRAITLPTFLILCIVTILPGHLGSR